MLQLQGRGRPSAWSLAYVGLLLLYGSGPTSSFLRRLLLLILLQHGQVGRNRRYKRCLVLLELCQIIKKSHRLGARLLLEVLSVACQAVKKRNSSAKRSPSFSFSFLDRFHGLRHHERQRRSRHGNHTAPKALNIVQNGGQLGEGLQAPVRSLRRNSSKRKATSLMLLFSQSTS